MRGDGNDHVNNLTPLMLAASVGSLQSVRCLLAAGARVNHRSSDNFTALFRSCAVVSGNAGRYADVVRVLLENGAEATAVRNGSTCLMFACYLGADEHGRSKVGDAIVRSLLKHGADPGWRAVRGESPNSMKMWYGQCLA